MMEVIHSTSVSRIVEGKQPSTGEIVRGREGGSLGDKFYTSYKHTLSACFYLIHACRSQAPMSRRIHRIDYLDGGNYTVNCLDTSNRRAYNSSCMHYTHNLVCLSYIR